ncbi:PfkB family carbohydrate kinase [Barrientosiimonas humi]|uniref:PfkB family carbohydrate kinase n=1 Tax=Barrientosiimonas humi TaxID=999931 RepID=UPI001FD2B14C|nr:PfkB family carbohydrate kinase [Barrientosiimonas humi]
MIKDADRRAVAVGRDGTQTEVPALRVEVVEAVGAGDSFAAGFLHGWLAGEHLQTCLRRGHIGAAATLTVHGDFARARADVVRRLLAADHEQWAGIRFTGADVLEPVG